MYELVKKYQMTKNNRLLIIESIEWNDLSYSIILLNRSKNNAFIMTILSRRMSTSYLT
jgi:hypothetical protein